MLNYWLSKAPPVYIDILYIAGSQYFMFSRYLYPTGFKIYKLPFYFLMSRSYFITLLDELNNQINRQINTIRTPVWKIFDCIWSWVIFKPTLQFNICWNRMYVAFLSSRICTHKDTKCAKHLDFWKSSWASLKTHGALLLTKQNPIIHLFRYLNCKMQSWNVVPD